jgi:hypothetical protein
MQDKPRPSQVDSPANLLGALKNASPFGNASPLGKPKSAPNVAAVDTPLGLLRAMNTASRTNSKSQESAASLIAAVNKVQAKLSKDSPTHLLSKLNGASPSVDVVKQILQRTPERATATSTKSVAKTLISALNNAQFSKRTNQFSTMSSKTAKKVAADSNVAATLIAAYDQAAAKQKPSRPASSWVPKYAQSHKWKDKAEAFEQAKAGAKNTLFSKAANANKAFSEAASLIKALENSVQKTGSKPKSLMNPQSNTGNTEADSASNLLGALKVILFCLLSKLILEIRVQV